MAIYYYKQTYTAPEILSLAAAKKQLKMEDLGTFDDVLIQDCIDAAIGEAENYCNRHINEAKYIVKSGHWLSQNYEFKQQLVSAITKITYKPLDGSADVELIDDDLAAFCELLPADQYASKLYYKDEYNFFFSSEIKAFSENINFDRTLNLEAISDYLSFLWSPGSNTPFKNVLKVLPGHYCKFNIENIFFRIN